MSDLPSLFRVGDELAMEPDNWLDQLLSSGALVEVTIDYEAAMNALWGIDQTDDEEDENGG